MADTTQGADAGAAGGGQGGDQTDLGVQGQHPAGTPGSGGQQQGSDAGPGPGQGAAVSHETSPSGDGRQGVSGAHPGTGEGGEDEGGDQGLLASQRRAAQQQGEGEGAQQQAPPADGRPESLPEQFWDAEKGEVRTDALVKAWSDTRQELKALKEQRGVAPPETPEDYKIEVPESFPQKFGDDDPALVLANKAAHEAGLSQDQYAKFVGTFLSSVNDEGLIVQPVSVEKEKERLGKHADELVNRVYNWGRRFVDQGVWSQDEFEEIVIMGSTADGIRALNKIIEKYEGEMPIPTASAVEAGNLPSKQELYAMVNDPRYKTDPAFYAKVTDLFKQVFGEGAAGTSQVGLGVPQSTVGHHPAAGPPASGGQKST